jgi:dihydrofolate synthase/folylpolyglutamate synthase
LEAARTHQANLEVLPREEATARDFRARNFALAKRVYQTIAQKDNLAALTEAQFQGVSLEQVPGRLQVEQRGAKTVVYDGAHNVQKSRALVATLRQLYPDRTFTVVLAMKRGKDYQQVVNELAPIARRFIATEFQELEGAKLRSASAADIAAACAATGVEVVREKNLNAARERALAGDDTHILVTGSLYALGEVL